MVFLNKFYATALMIMCKKEVNFALFHAQLNFVCNNAAVSSEL
jgi:hypothetical protein